MPRSTRSNASLALPALSTDALVGRQTELELLRDAAARGERLVTLIGPSGVGKTRLAEHHAREVAGQTAVCDLSEARTPEDVCAIVTRAVGLPLGAEDGSANPATRLALSLRTRRALLVLDGFEHLVADAPGLLSPWLAHAPELRLLVTSRERLRLPGELGIEVPPLAVPEADEDAEHVSTRPAVQLFVLRARAARSDFALTEANAPTIAAIVRKLDGLPLAIELCAARMGVLGPRQMLAQLARCLDVLGAGPRSAAPRQQTLRAAIDWSWKLLPPQERDVLAQCSVFRAGFGARAAEQVLEMPASTKPARVRDVLQALHDKSLLVAYEPPGLPGELRYRLLESIRDFASEELASSGAEAATLARHAAHYLTSGEALRRDVERSASPDAWRRLALESDNLLAVCHRALDHAPAAPARTAAALTALLVLEPILTARGPLGAYVDLLSAALAGDTAEPVTRARALLARAGANGARGRPEASVADVEEALTSARTAGARDVEALALIRLGVLGAVEGRFQQAERRFAEAAEILRRGGDGRLLGIFHADLGTALSRAERSDEAMRHRKRSLELLRRAGDLPRLAFVLGQLGAELLELGRLEAAERHCAQALDLLRELGNRRIESRVLAVLARVQQERGLFAEAGASIARARALQRDLGADSDEAVLLRQLGDLEMEQGHVEPAHDAYVRASERAADVRDPAFTAVLGASFAAIEARRGQPGEAEERFDAAAETLRGAGLGGAAAATVAIHRGHLEIAWARSAIAAGDAQRARRHIEIARAPLARAVGSLEPSNELRLAARILERELALVESGRVLPPVADPEAPSLTIGPAAEWFERPGADRVSLLGQRAIRAVLLHLCDELRRAPGKATTMEQIFQAGWPAERIRRDAMAHRVHVALTKLRKLGLRDVLHSRDDGFLLSPELVLAWDGASAP